MSARARASILARSASGREAMTSFSFRGIATSRSFSCPALFEPGTVDIESPVGDRDQSPIKRPLGRPTLVAGHQQDRLPLRIEGKSDAPDAPRRIEAQLLHIGVLRALECIDTRPAGRWAELLDNACLCQQFDADLGRQRQNFEFEFRCKLDRPHSNIYMPYVAYAVKSIFQTKRTTFRTATGMAR